MVIEGDKQTEPSVLPNGWKIIAFGELYAEPSRNGIYKSAEYQGQGTKIVNMGEMFGFEFISDQEMNRVLLTTQELSANCLRDGDLVFGRRSVVPAGAGKCSIVVAPSEALVFESSIIRVRLNQSVVSPLFQYYFFASSVGRSLMSVIIAGTNVKGIRSSELKELRIPLPPCEEQQAIAKALSDVDGLIDGLEKLIAKKRDIKTATMQQLLTGKTRLPGFGEGKGYKQTELGEIPEDWDVVTFGNIGQCLIGLTYSPADTSHSGTLVLRSSNVQDGRLAYYDNVYVDMDVPDRVITQAGDILVCVRNGSRALIGKVALIDEQAAGHAFGAFMSIFRTEHSGFVFHHFQSTVIKKQLAEMMGATINQITNKDMSSFKIPLPTRLEEEQAIVEVISDMDNEIETLQTRLDKTKAIKQGMMQELLTGKTRLI